MQRKLKELWPLPAIDSPNGMLISQGWAVFLKQDADPMCQEEYGFPGEQPMLDMYVHCCFKCIHFKVIWASA